MRNHIQPGNTLTIPAPADVLSGGVVQVGEIIGIAASTVAAGESVDVDVVGVFQLPKVAADAINLGDPVYWDADARLVTVTATDNTRLGVATEAAPAASGTVRVRLSGF